MVQTSAVKVHRVTTGETFGADEDLLSQVKRQIPLTVTHWLESLVIIVFCPITSRVGSDVEAAMNRVPEGDQNVILVLMHHTRDQDYPTAGMRWSETYPRVIMDIHVAFHETVRGLLQCAKNTMAVDQLVDALDDCSGNQQIIRVTDRDVLHCCSNYWTFPHWKVVVPSVVLVVIIIILLIVVIACFTY